MKLAQIYEMQQSHSGSPHVEALNVTCQDT